MAADPPLPVGGAFGLPPALPGGAAAGLFVGSPGGVSGPPGGVPAPPLQALTLLAPLPGAMQAGALAPPPGGALPGAGLPGAGLPGAGVPVALPDLAEVARAALEGVVAPVGSQTPHGATAPANRPALPPPPPPGSGTAPPLPPGLWRGPPPAPVPAPAHQSGWPVAVEVPEERDLVQRIGDGLYPLVERLRESRVGWFGVVALFGITVPIILLRQSFNVWLRLIGAAVTFFTWLGLIQDII